MKSLSLLALAAGLLASPAAADPFALSDTQLGAIAAGVRFTITPRISDQPGAAPVTDPLLVNPWGLAAVSPTAPLWVANAGSGTSTVYNQSTFGKLSLAPNVPGAPTGATAVAQGAGNFVIQGTSSPAVFAFATETGQIRTWAGSVSTTDSFASVDNGARGDIYTGLTLAGTGDASKLMAADFAHGLVRVFDRNFSEVSTFTDPGVPAGFAPFNVQVLNGSVYVTFAKQGDTSPVATGQGLGFISVFKTDGTFVRRLVTHGQLNAPWGVTIAPASFGKLAGALVVGNFGDGQINAFDAETGAFIDHLRDDTGKLQIERLWALRNAPDGSIVFSAGVGAEQHGLVGTIQPSAMQAMFGAQERASLAEMHAIRLP